MSLLRAVASELVAMFLADARLAASILALVGFVAVLIGAVGAEPLVGGAILALGCVAILIVVVLHGAKQRKRN